MSSIMRIQTLLPSSIKAKPIAVKFSEERGNTSKQLTNVSTLPRNKERNYSGDSAKHRSRATWKVSLRFYQRMLSSIPMEVAKRLPCRNQSTEPQPLHVAC